MRPAAIITGIGLATPLGIGVDETWRALLAGRAIRDHARVAHLDEKESRIFQIAHRAAVTAGAGKPRPDALVVGSSKGEADAWIANASLPLAGIGNLAAQLGDVLKIPGPRLTISAACASGLQALIRGALLIAAGDAQRVLVVAAESSLHPMFLENYRRLGVLAPEGAGCRPFDRDRQGFCLSEAAAAVMLERDLTAEETEDHGGETNAECLPPSSSVSSAVKNPRHQPPAGADKKIAVESVAFGSDATHLTGSDPTGKPLRNLLARVTAGRQFDLIHAHGTGTVANDAIELAALESVLAEQAGTAPLVYSHKAALGHSLGAAGLISIVLNVQMHRSGIVPGNTNTPHPLPARRLTISSQPERRPIRRSLAIAAGFGGAMAAVSLNALE
ncbi:MAG TPA: beta-ketoacyl synthase N-terminal-like domain-containing protein [Tepidisphaeraceae bacterium]|jgi:3-oxoacyl-[acyl-carrier-protein] synthase II|nr:beta-ketoacyl synthase N-terminal-like domain-containing protein [Tepidisphaeraceae bacterium]